MKAYIAIPQSMNPGVAAMGPLFTKLMDLNEKKGKIVENM